MFTRNVILYMKSVAHIKIGNEGSITDAVQEIIEALPNTEKIMGSIYEDLYTELYMRIHSVHIACLSSKIIMRNTLLVPANSSLLKKGKILKYEAAM